MPICCLSWNELSDRNDKMNALLIQLINLGIANNRSDNVSKSDTEESAFRLQESTHVWSCIAPLQSCHRYRICILHYKLLSISIWPVYRETYRLRQYLVFQIWHFRPPSKGLQWETLRMIGLLQRIVLSILLKFVQILLTIYVFIQIHFDLEISEYHNSFYSLTFFISFTKFVFWAIVVGSASRDTLFNLGVCFWTNISEILQYQILVNIIDQSLK